MKRLLIFLLILSVFFITACNGGGGDDDNETQSDSATTSEVLETAEAVETPEPVETSEVLEPVEAVETPDPVETVEAIETPDPVETVEAVETTDPAETPDPMETVEAVETPDPAETPEVSNINLDSPLPNTTDDGAFFVAPSRAMVEETIAVEEAPEGSRWIMATVTLANQSDSTTIVVEEEDIFLIGDDAQRYTPQEMVERVNPALVGSELAPSESVIGFALFALPEDVIPVLFEWCPLDDCGDTPLQAQITFQE